MIKLHVFPPSPRAFKVLWTANHLGIDYETVLIDFSKSTHKTPAFANLNPNMRMPVLEVGSYVLWESNAIIQYLASLNPSAGLLPEETKARLSIVKWQFWDCAHWDPACAVFAFENYVKKLFGMGEPSDSELERGNQLIARLAPVLDGEMQKHRYVAGETLTVADFSLGGMFYIAEHAKFPLEPYRGIQRWAADLRSLPSWKKTVEQHAK